MKNVNKIANTQLPSVKTLVKENRKMKQQQEQISSTEQNVYFLTKLHNVMLR